MIRRKTEEIDEDGRRRIVTTEEPAGRDYRENATDMADADSEVEEVAQSRADTWEIARGWVRTIAIWVLVALVALEALLAFRLAFLLGGANPDNGFVDFIYDVSAPLVDPFEGIAGNSAMNGGVFEPAALIAMVVYLVVAVLIVAVIWAATAGPSPTGQRAVTSRTRHRATVHED